MTTLKSSLSVLLVSLARSGSNIPIRSRLVQKISGIALLAMVTIFSSCATESNRKVPIETYLTHAQTLYKTFSENSLEAATALTAAHKYIQNEHIDMATLQNNAAAALKNSFKLQSTYSGRIQLLKKNRDALLSLYPHFAQSPELIQLLSLLVLLPS